MKRMFLASIILLLALGGATALYAQTIVRGPYLQSPGATSIIIRWRTDVATDSRVSYGTNISSKTQTADDFIVTTEHRIKLTGLAPRTKYYYSVGSISLALRGDSLLHFTTAPEPGSSAPVRLWAIGDFGHGNEAERLVRDSYLALAAAERPADLQLWLGDNAYQDGTDAEYQAKVFDSIYSFHHVFMNLPFAPSPGNHDWASICNWMDPCNTDPYLQTGPYLDIIDPPTEGELGGVPSHLKLFYSFDYGNIHFISLNSELGSLTPAYNWVGVFDNDTAFTSPMISWLKNDIASTDRKWIIAFWHQCPYSGQDNFTEQSSFQFFTFTTRRHFNPILERFGVDLVLTGHDHNYQRSYLINGLYDFKAAFTPDMIINGTSGNDLAGEAYIKYTDGPLADKGTVYVVEGNSSGSNGYSPIEHPVIYWGQACDTCYGSLVVDIEGDRLDARYLTAYGEVLDRFTILKQSSTGIAGAQPFGYADIYPNPAAGGQTSIRFSLMKKSNVRIDVLDLSGKSLRIFVNEIREPGNYRDVLNLKGAGISNGAYLIRLDCAGVVKVMKVMMGE
ncbi:MAG TPA: metallophosphoesterase [Chitinophagales bacterium]|nr:metallophosphoesterase [Chitinophagales bacterium]